MKKLITIIALLLPLTAFGATYTGSWNYTSTSSPVFQPTQVFGTYPPLRFPYLIATSTTDSSIFAGNVGIGTTSPTANLSVVGLASAPIIFSDDFAGNTLNTSNWTPTGTVTQNDYIEITGNTSWNDEGLTSVASYARGNSLTLTMDVVGDAYTNVMVGFSSATGMDYANMPHAIYFASGSDFQVYENGSFKGSFGSFTPGVQYKVKIVTNDTGAMYYQSSNGGTTWTLLYDGTGNGITNTPLYIREVVYSGTPYTDNVVLTRGVAQPTALFLGGNVGIGTTSPTSKLTVDGTITSPCFSNDGVNCVGGVGSQWITNGSDIYYASGNVGIGISNPAYPLDIYSSNPQVFNLRSTSSTHNSYGIVYNDEGHYALFAVTAGGVGTFQTDGGAFEIQKTGGVLTEFHSGKAFFGATTDDGSGAMLQVTGDINVSSQYKVGGVAGLTQNITYMKTALISCVAHYTGGILTSVTGTSCP